MMPFQRMDHRDDDALRDRVTASLDALLAAAADGDREARLHLLGQLGSDQWALGNLLEADMFLTESVALARTLGDLRRAAAYTIRLATVRQDGGGHAEAESMLRAALSQTEQPETAIYHDFALQHLGKCLVEMEEIAEAISCFEAALALRLAKGDAALIASTEAALTAARLL